MDNYGFKVQGDKPRFKLPHNTAAAHYPQTLTKGDSQLLWQLI